VLSNQVRKELATYEKNFRQYLPVRITPTTIKTFIEIVNIVREIPTTTGRVAISRKATTQADVEKKAIPALKRRKLTKQKFEW